MILSQFFSILPWASLSLEVIDNHNLWRSVPEYV